MESRIPKATAPLPGRYCVTAMPVRTPIAPIIATPTGGGLGRFATEFARTALIPAALLYSLVIRLRNARYDFTPSASSSAGVPVISIGNLTVGGTGKTPLVIETISRLLALGRRPAVLTRGYGGKPGAPADEVVEYRLAVPAAPVIVNPDRVAGAARAIRERSADVLVMDDGFQHRRLRRDLEIVLLDGLDPWGSGWLLPAGRLREPISSLRRAAIVILTRSDAASSQTISEVEEALRRYQPQALLLHAHSELCGIVDEHAGDMREDDLAHSAVLPVTALGNPAGFERLVAGHAGRVAPPRRYRDHHRYTPQDAAEILAVARHEDADAVVTSRKDWVKLSPLWPREAAVPLWRLDVRTVLHDPEGEFDRRLSECLAGAA